MNRLTSVTDLERLQRELVSQNSPEKPTITVCQGTGCKAYASGKIHKAFEKELASRGLTQKVSLKSTGCHGFCEQGPIVVILPEEICYCRVKPEDIAEIVETTVVKKKTVDRLIFTDPVSGEKYAHEQEIPFYKYQRRAIFGKNRLVDPKNIEDYITLEGYSALAHALTRMNPEKVMLEVKKANLRGRGGAGFPTGIKWETTQKAPGETKYVVVNADEGDPGAYMDRSLLEGNPHLVLEGLAIGAYAIGAREGYVFVRQEYPLALENINAAVQQARDYGLLGKNILGTGFDFDVKVKRGAGAFVSGESSALISAIEGRAGEPRPKHVNAAVSGLFGKPTSLNNVETWANVPLIMNKGAQWYSSIGSEKNSGTKIFSLVGKVNNTGLIEVPMGTPLRTIIYNIGGGIKEGKRFKAVQTGGPSGGCIPEQHLDIPVDFDCLSQMGSMMGSGGMIVMDEDSCMVDVAKYFMQFLKEESCGKCISCREGISKMYDILEKITLGEGCERDLEQLENLAWITDHASLCALGRTASNPVLSTLKYFREEYDAHIQDKRCPAGVCKSLISYTIDPDRCNGCGRCQKVCSVNAVEGEKGSPMSINKEFCIRCGICQEACRFKAVSVE
ncbi:NADH-quinone oxidoreductase subunit NuoF [Candidatus Contubernalis alkalaceticus]|uniref:NADH-quinone oxidoreductase subunit NuoF n=1 Tax=Candidatus Contubernalis alkaliaceticus TaxID=338645 RepID=UPI002962011A|nr:NADH-quinone oxidoreductase subunit NuoF [Candidatus Contubernalis alkalaceticus]UNC91376.1 NADH-quinone oxidoreductase subunit NuoF [Candidatus Contubernalis alkalaceticus]